MRRRLAALIGVALTLGGSGSALSVNAVIRRAARLPEGASVPVIAPPSDIESSAPVADIAPPLRSKGDYIDGIIGRNIFDPDAIGKSMPGGDLLALSDLDVKLIGTIVAVPETYSSALLVDAASVARGYGIGDKVQDAEIVKIEADKVHVKRANGDIEIISMGGIEPSRPASSGDGTADAGGLEEGIEQVSDTKFVIDRAVYDRYMSDLDAISSMGRAIPHRGADGEIDGYRLSGIRRNSLGSQVGIKNGDIVHSVNGKPLISMKDALDAFGTLQSESAFSFEVTRRGQKVTLEYEVR